METKKDLETRINQARGIENADYVLKNCRVINVFSGEILSADVAFTNDRIAGVGRYNGKIELDCANRYVCPGFIDGHIHIESSLLTPAGFSEIVVPHGTTAVVCDPHEVANVSGVSSLEYFLKASEDTAITFFVLLPSCVPATHLETSGAVLGWSALEPLLSHPRVIGLAEMMNFPGLLAADSDVIEKIHMASSLGLHIDGHSPMLTGLDLQAYAGAGIKTDHECIAYQEALDKLRAGMYILVREGSNAKNMKTLLPLAEFTDNRLLLVSDDCHVGDLIAKGHLDALIRKAVGYGIDPVTAIQMVTVNTASCFGLSGYGAVAPGYRADVLLLDGDLQDMEISKVYVGGKCVADNGAIVSAAIEQHKSSGYSVFSSVSIDWSRVDFSIPARKGRLRIITLVKGQLVTELELCKPLIVNKEAVADVDRDLVKIAVIERHAGSGNMAAGFVKGFGFKRGAIAGTVAHDSHNLIVAGVSDIDMMCASQCVARQGGGFAVALDGKILEFLQLDVAGLMSTQPAQVVDNKYRELLAAVKLLGGHLDNPFMAISFLALPVIPWIKITDKGLVDVSRGALVPLWE